jgi:hypothetical protein
MKTGTKVGIVLLLLLVIWYAKSRAAAAPKPPVYDLNGDGRVNVMEMVMIGNHWGETGAPGWIPEDVAQDGIINQADVDALKPHWTG